MKPFLFYCTIIAAVLLTGGVVVRGEESDMHAIRPCPNSPNCVSSRETRPKHVVEPMRYTGDLETARRRLLDILAAFPRVRIVNAGNRYIHAEFRSLVFRFVDDVEFWLPPNEDIVHLRSASRVGYWDLGANRKRVEQIRQIFEKPLTP